MRLSGPNLRVVGVIAAIGLVVASPFVFSTLRRGPASAPAPTPSPPLDPREPAAAPRTFFGLTDRGDIVVADSATGRAIRTLFGAAGLRRDDRIRNLTLSPDRNTMYFVIHHDDDCSGLASVPVAGGQMRNLGPGDAPAPSPDGSRLAYVDLLNCGGHDARVVVRDLASGAERAWKEKPADLFPRLAAHLVWSPDPRFVMVSSCGADSCGPSLLDIGSGGELWAATKRVPGSDEDDGDAFWGCWTVRGRRGTLVVKTDYSSSDGSEPHPVNEVDFGSGKVRALVPFGKGLGCFAFDVAGDHALFIRDGVVHRWNPAKTAVIRRGYTEAVW